LVPPAVSNHTIAFDIARGKIVFFGGGSGAAVFNETWEFDGHFWAKKISKNNPPKRSGHVMVYDPVLCRVILFGGYDGTTFYNDTWMWDGINWTIVNTTISPPARDDCAMVYDYARNLCVLFGGFNGKYLNDMWTFNGKNWTQQFPSNPATVPSSRNDHSMAYDAVNNEIVLYGGINNFGVLTDTWVFKNGSWTKKNPAVKPQAGRHTGMIFDYSHCLVVLFGGYDGKTCSANTWLWDGKNWTQGGFIPSPSPRSGIDLAYDFNRKCTVLYGGFNGKNPLADTWDFTNPAVLTASGTGNRGTTVTFNLSVPADAGKQYLLGSSFGSGPIPIGYRKIELTIDCLLILSVIGFVGHNYSGVLDTAGRAIPSPQLPIPNNNGLIGLKITSAFVTIDPTALNGIKSISNPVTFTVR